MRLFLPLAAAAAVGSCTTAPPPAPAPLTPDAQAKLNQYLGGRVAGPPENCIPNWRAQQMIVIDDSTIVFREGPGRVWLQRTRGDCDRLSGIGYALVTQTVGPQLCSGDIAQVLDTSANMTVANCVMGPFIPYRRAGS